MINIKKIRNWIKQRQLKIQEKKWQLYNDIPEFDLQFCFAFIDQLRIGGHYHAPITWDNNKTVNNAVIVVNLNKRINQEVLISTINHECLHTAIANCLKEPSNNMFIETVIEDWLLGEKLHCDTWEGAIEVRFSK